MASEAAIDTLVDNLQKANWAYHNTDKPICSDEEYDKMLEELKRRSPTHPFLRVVGAPVKGKSVILPYIMGSLDKMRYGEGSVEKWIAKQDAKQKSDEYIYMEKLDGLSALYINKNGKKNLYLRGDGVKGVDVSRALEKIFLPDTDCVIRGELVLSNEDTPKGSIGRSLVNGWAHKCLDKKNPIPEEIKKVSFTGYQVLEPTGLTRKEQIFYLLREGFRIPWALPMGKKTEEELKDILNERKKESKYPLDGIVIGTNTIPKEVKGDVSNPEDMVAFKASLDDQKELTSIIKVEWNLSRQNIWIPRIQIEAVNIGGATIQWVSGHNASNIYANNLGPGARVIIRRSGDVIPTIDTVLEGSIEGPEMPEEGSWEWDETRVHARKIQIEGEEDESERSLLHSLQTLEVEGIGPGLVKKLYEGGYTSMKSVWEGKEEQLGKYIGFGRVKGFIESLKRGYEKADESILLIASNRLPRGVGEKKLRGLYSLEESSLNWNKRFASPNGVPSGWTRETMDVLLEALPNAHTWIESTFGKKVDSANSNKLASGEVKEKVKQVEKNGRNVVFTGVRDKELEGILENKGWEIGDSVSKKTEYLVVADGEIKESAKVKKARELGVKILTVKEMRECVR
jgi:NAD-dependent DNA ligase